MKFSATQPAARLIACALLAAGLGAGMTAWAESAAATKNAGDGDGDVRGAAGKGLGYLAKAGDRWMEEKTCVSCHHMPLLIWTHLEAEKRGYFVDKAQFQTWLDWSGEQTPKATVGMEALAQLILALPADLPGLPAALQPVAMKKRLVEAQEKNGTWKPGGQFASMQRREGGEPVEASTRLIAMALDSGESLDRALAHLGPGTDTAVVQSVETLVWRVELARRLHREAEAARCLDGLLKTQHEDGGWSWRVGEARSDALATGQALHVLRTARDDADAKARARAVAWLRKNQAADGSWPVQSVLISRLPGADHLRRTDDIYTFWGTAWATLGLMAMEAVGGGRESE